jgi:carbamoyl-phosphate synthase large subunit
MYGETISVLLTGVGGGGHGEQILKALRLGKLRYRIVGTDASETCANRGKVDEFLTVPLAREKSYFETIVEIARSRGCIAIFHGSEPEMTVLSNARSELSSAGLYVPVNPPSVLELCQDKVKTTVHLQKHGFVCPSFREARSQEDLRGFTKFPIIVKPSVYGGGSANVFIAQSVEELEFFAAYLLKLHGRFIAQEYVGTPNEEYTVGVLFGQDGVLLNSIPIRRIINSALTIRTKVPNRSGRPELGDNLIVSTGISQGEVGHWPEIRRQCEAIASSLAPRAPINIQCRVVDGQVFPFEINPRFSGTTSLRALAGYNEPEVLIRRDVLGENVAPYFAFHDMTILRGLEEMVVQNNPSGLRH